MIEVNEEAYRDFFWFVNERHRIYRKKSLGESKPWSDDPIFQNWRFCNVFRNLDKQSSYLLTGIVYPHENDDPGLLIFNIFAFRAFNWFPTYQSCFGWTTNFDSTYAKMLLKNRANNGEQLISGAYMIRGAKGKPKYESIPASLERIWEDREWLAEGLKYQSHPNLQGAYEMILGRHYWGWGPFTTYQIVLDLSYTPLLKDPVDINDWCYFGPGAVRGMREIWPELPKKEMLAYAKELLEDQDKYREPHVPELDLQSVEFCLCELSKYRRIKIGGHGKGRYPGA